MPQLDAAGVLQALEAREDTPGAQDGFDAGASVLLASLPPAPRRCPWGPLSWYAPVVHVKRHSAAERFSVMGNAKARRESGQLASADVPEGGGPPEAHPFSSSSS
ncbi:unnamed protein product, partial [Prorocentrum cordatum]